MQQVRQAVDDHDEAGHDGPRLLDPVPGGYEAARGLRSAGAEAAALTALLLRRAAQAKRAEAQRHRVRAQEIDRAAGEAERTAADVPGLVFTAARAHAQAIHEQADVLATQAAQDEIAAEQAGELMARELALSPPRVERWGSRARLCYGQAGTFFVRQLQQRLGPLLAANAGPEERERFERLWTEQHWSVAKAAGMAEPPPASGCVGPYSENRLLRAEWEAPCKT